MSAPRVSVVVPVYNRTQLLKRALGTVLAQSFRDFEIVVVDDGSSDDVEGALESLNDGRIRLVRHERNRGAAAARNTGVGAARGELIAFLDSDDEWLPEKLARQVAYLEAAPPCAPLCCTGYELRRSEAAASADWERYLPPQNMDARRHLLWGCDLSPGTTLLARRECFDAVGPFDEALRRLEDWDWLLRSAEIYRVGVLREVLARIHVGAWPESAEVFDALERIEAKHLGAIRRRSPLDARKFKSTLLLERAAAHYRERRIREARRYGVLSFLQYPFRNLGFYRRQARRALGIRPVASGGTDASSGVVHVITGLGQGGAEGMLARLVLAMSRESPSPLVVSLMPGGGNAALLRARGVRVLDLGMRRGRTDLLAALRLARILRRERPEVVQSWMYHADLLALLALYLSGRRRSTRLYWGIRCSDMDLSRYGLLLRAVVGLCARLSRLPDGIVVNSEAGLALHRRLGYRARAFYLVDNGLDAAEYAPEPEAREAVRRALGVPHDAVVAICVARVDPMKDHATLFEAFAGISGVKLLLVGAGTEKLPAQENAIALGPRTDVPRLLAASDLLVLSSAFGEGFSNAIVEGMAAGLPVVATEVGDARRIVGEAGRIVPPRDPEALAAAIRELAASKDVRQRLGAAARERVVREFAMERALEAFERIHAGRAVPFGA